VWPNGLVDLTTFDSWSTGYKFSCQLIHCQVTKCGYVVHTLLSTTIWNHAAVMLCSWKLTAGLAEGNSNYLWDKTFTPAGWVPTARHSLPFIFRSLCWSSAAAATSRRVLH